jgi:hypothetical protein
MSELTLRFDDKFYRAHNSLIRIVIITTTTTITITIMIVELVYIGKYHNTILINHLKDFIIFIVLRKLQILFDEKHNNNETYFFHLILPYFNAKSKFTSYVHFFYYETTNLL